MNETAAFQVPAPAVAGELSAAVVAIGGPAALADAQARFRCLFDASPIGIVVLTLEGCLSEVNEAFCRIVGRDRAQLLGMSLVALELPEDPQLGPTRTRPLLGALARPSEAVQMRCAHASGRSLDLVLHATVLPAAGDERPHVVAHVQDVTDELRHRRRLDYLADHDQLTGLLNRRAFHRELASHAALLARCGETGSVLVVGLDHFKFVNDALGRQAGDSLIARAGQLLQERLRGSDVLARLGGDEFGVLLPQADSTHALRVADSLLGALRCQRIRIGGLTHTVTASIGVASFEYGRQVRGEHVLVNADRAMWDAKDDGRNRTVLYSATTLHH